MSSHENRSLWVGGGRVFKGNFKLSRQTIHRSAEEPQSQTSKGRGGRSAQGHMARVEGGTETVLTPSLLFSCPALRAARVKHTIAPKLTSRLGKHEGHGGYT